MACMSISNSPDSCFIQALNEVSKSESFIVREIMSRISSIVLPLFAVLGSLYNLVAVVVKLPILVVRYTVGYIPNKWLHSIYLSQKKEGKIADSFPEATDAASVARQLAAGLLGKVMGAALTVFSLLSPKAAVKVAAFSGLYETGMEKPPSQPSTREILGTGQDLSFYATLAQPKQSY
jgi:hypothetical protein